MRRMRPLLALLVCLSPLAARAQAGGYFTVGVGWAAWSLDRQKVESQVSSARPDLTGDSALFFDQSLHDAVAVPIRLGWNIAGHVHVGALFVPTGWNVTTADRGGAGWLGGEVGWHPLALLGPPRDYDVALTAEYGYSIVGQHRALDGYVFGAGVQGEWKMGESTSLGLRFDAFLPGYSRYIVDYDHRSDPANVVALPRGAGGHLYVPQAFVAFHFGGGGK